MLLKLLCEEEIIYPIAPNCVLCTGLYQFLLDVMWQYCQVSFIINWGFFSWYHNMKQLMHVTIFHRGPILTIIFTLFRTSVWWSSTLAYVVLESSQNLIPQGIHSLGEKVRCIVFCKKDTDSEKTSVVSLSKEFHQPVWSKLLIEYKKRISTI